VLRVVRKFKNSFLELLQTPERMWAHLEWDPPSLLGRDENNNTLLHLLYKEVRAPSSSSA
jgi:hypothetical protein